MSCGAGQGTVEDSIKGYKIGDVASDFNLKNVDGKMVSLANYADAKGFVVIFTCNHCPFSVKYEDRIIGINEKYSSLGYPVIAINPNDPEAKGGEDDGFDDMVIRAKEKGFKFPYLFDEGQLIYPKYGATKTPHVFLLMKTDKGNVVKYIGAIDDNSDDASEVKEKYLENALNSLLEGKDPTPSMTVALGCSIKTNK